MKLSAAALLAAAAALVLSASWPALAQESSDGTRTGAVSLGVQSPDLGTQFFGGKSLDRAAGDGVDYYVFSVDARYQLGLGVRGQSIDLLAYLEDADGNEIAVSGPPLDPGKDQTIEWLPAIVEAGTYYVRVEAQEDGATGYYIRFGLTDAPEAAPEATAEPESGVSVELRGRAADESVRLMWDISGTGHIDDIYIVDMYLERLGADSEVESSDWIESDVYGDEESPWKGWDYGLDPGTTYRYRVRLETESHGDVYSDVLSITTQTSVPAAPTGLSASPTHDTVSLSWTVPVQPSWVSEDPYLSVRVMRKNLTVGGVAVEAGRVRWQEGVTGYGFTDAGAGLHRLFPGHTFEYHIEAYMGGRLHRSEPLSVTLAPLPEDPDGTREGAVELDAEAFFRLRDRYGHRYLVVADQYLHMGGGDSVDYYTFSTAERYRLTLEARDRRIELGVTVEDAGGETVIESSPSMEPVPMAERVETTLAPGTYYVRVEALEDGVTGYYVLFSLAVPAADEANDPPQFGAPSYEFSIAEDADVGDSVGSVRAADPNADSVDYAIVAGNGDGRFAIDSGTGAITVAAGLDRETASVYTLRVQAVDGNGAAAAAEVGIAVAENPIVGFTLLDATDQTVLAELTDGASVGLPDPGGGSYAIVANMAEGHDTGSVRLELAGAAAAGPRTDNLAPYSLLGEDEEDAPLGGPLPDGGYTLSATAYPEAGLTGNALGALEVSFVVLKPGSALRGLGGGSQSSVHVGATQDGVPYVEFLSEPAPRQQQESQQQESQQQESQQQESRGIRSGAPVLLASPSFGAAPPQGSVPWARQVSSESVPETVISGLGTSVVQAFWSEGDTLWVSLRSSGADWDGSIQAYDLTDGSRDSDNDIDLALPDSSAAVRHVGESHGLWMDSDTVWVSSSGTSRLLAYDRSDGARKSSEDYTALDSAGNDNPMGLWADSSFMYVVDKDDRKVYVYSRATKALARTMSTGGRSNDEPVGLWSDGATFWVSDRTDAKIYAYRLSDGGRLDFLDIRRRTSDVDRRLSEDNTKPQALWSDRTQLWVADAGSTRVFVYNLPADARLASLRFDDEELIRPGSSEDGFWLLKRTDSVSGAYVTVKAEPRRSGAKVVITPADAEEGVEGHQVAVDRGRVSFTVTVTDGPADDSRTATYEILIERPSGLTDIIIDGRPIPDFDFFADKMDYTYEVPPHLSWVTVTLLAQTMVPRSVTPGDAKPDISGHQISLEPDGTTRFTVSMNWDGRRLVYTVDLIQNGLRSLGVTDVNMAGFSPSVTDYERNVAGDVTEVTVKPEAIRAGAAVTVTPADADTNSTGHQVSLVADGETDITVTVSHGDDSQTYTLTLTQLSGTTGTLSDDSSLSALSLTGVTLKPAFSSDVTEYTHQLSAAQFSDGFTTTVAATPAAGATAVVSPADADTNTLGHQIEVPSGQSSTIKITVSPQDGTAERNYSVRLVTTGRDASKDLGGRFHKSPYDIWSDGETMWVLYLRTNSPIIRAYALDDGRRQSQHDITPDKAHSYWDAGLWSDGETMWVAEPWSRGEPPYVEAIEIDSSTHIFSESFFDSVHPRDLWSDGETIWVAQVSSLYVYVGNDETPKDGKLKAFNFATKARDADKDITVTTTGDTGRLWNARISFALWSDGTVMWVAANEGDRTSRLEAYELANGTRVPGMDIAVGEDGITHPRGMWSNGRTMWVLDAPLTGTKWSGIHAYRLPPNAKLFSLAMSDVDFGHFIHGRPKYTAEVANTVTVTTVTYEQAFTGGSSSVAISAAAGSTTVTTDADTNTEGYQVNLAEGENVITITVTAPNGTDTYAYTVTITRAAS